MTSNLEIEDVIERAENFLTHQEGIEETSLSEVRQPGGLDGRRKKLDAEDYIVSREHNGQIIKIHFDKNVADQTERNVKAKILQNNIGKLIVDTKREYDLKTDSFQLVPCNVIRIIRGTNQLQNFKSKLINFCKQTHNVLSPWEIPGGERFQILLKRNTSGGGGLLIQRISYHHPLFYQTLLGS